MALGRQAFDEDEHHRFLQRLRADAIDALARSVAIEIDHRMEHRADRRALVDQFAHDRFDDEGRVRLDDFDDIVTGRLAGGGEQGGDPPQGPRRRPFGAIGPEPGNGGIDVGDIEARQFVGVEIIEDRGQEDLFRRVQGVARRRLAALDEGGRHRVVQGRGGRGRRIAGNKIVHDVSS